MSIIIRKKDTGDMFDVFPDFVLEVQNTSPLFNSLGSKTVATTLPRTPHNARLFGFADRTDIAAKPRLKMPVIVAHQSYVREGMLYLSAATNTERSFGVTIAFNEGIMYEAMQDLKLTQLTSLPVIEKPFDQMIAYMNYLLQHEALDEPFSVFRIYLKDEKGKDKGFDLEVALRTIINEIDGKALDTSANTYIINEGTIVSVDVPAGYGISPFVKVWAVIEYIFDHFGYTVKTNPFKTEFQLNRLVVLNNVTDAIVLNRIDVAQLLPDIPIYEFLNSLFCRFGTKVFFDSNTNQVHLYLIRDLLQASDMTELPMASLPDLEYTPPKQLHLSASTALERSAVDTETYEEFLEKYNYTISIWEIQDGTKHGGIYYEMSTGLYYRVSTLWQQYKVISSVHFDWNKKVEGLETEAIKSIDECLTMDYYTIYYGLSPCLKNSMLSTNSNAGEQDNSVMKEPNKLAFAYDMGEAYVLDNDGKKTYLGYKHGSIFTHVYGNPYITKEDKDGNKFRYALTFVGVDGAFNHFFREYDAFLRHSNNSLTLETHMPLFDLAGIDLSAKRYMLNQPLLLDKVDYHLGGSDRGKAKITARTLRLYGPYDLQAEHGIPQSWNITYKWILTDNREEKIREAFEADKKAFIDYLDNASNGYYSLFVSKELTADRNDPSPPQSHDYWFLPPTDQEYRKGTTVGYSKHTMTAKFYYSYALHTQGGEQTVTHNVTVEYNGVFSPDGLGV